MKSNALKQPGNDIFALRAIAAGVNATNQTMNNIDPILIAFMWLFDFGGAAPLCMFSIDILGLNSFTCIAMYIAKQLAATASTRIIIIINYKKTKESYNLEVSSFSWPQFEVRRKEHSHETDQLPRRRTTSNRDNTSMYNHSILVVLIHFVKELCSARGCTMPYLEDSTNKNAHEIEND